MGLVMNCQKESELGFDPSVHQKELLKTWKKFIETGQIEGNIVPSYIAESWKKSRERNIDPFHFSPLAYLNQSIYRKRKSNHQYLISVAKPLMERVYQSLEESRYLVVLYNSEGHHLLRIGRVADFERSAQFSIQEGLCFEEEKVGTCGFSLVKWLRKPIQIIGCEHYLALLHYVVGSYAPINSPEGNLIGVIGITGVRTKPNPHTLGMSIALTNAIENYIELDHSRKISFVYGKALRSMMDSLSDGIILIDTKGEIYEINISASKIFELGEREGKGRHISNVIQKSNLEKLFVKTLKNHDWEEREMDIEIQGHVYVATIKRIWGKEGDEYGFMLQFRSLKSMSQIVHDRTVRVKTTFDAMIGSSSKMINLKNVGRIAAKSDASIIIEGESGTGKDIFAQAIHNESIRKNEPFVIVNCSAVPSELLESTLFGHEKGAFTGANHVHIGKFELANHGTVFLDEIAEMPMNMQAKILRVLEAKTIEKVGGRKTIDIDIRIITATNRNLLREIQENRFREDLFYRLSVFRIELPPLRERKKEIYQLVPFFVHQFASPLNKIVENISEGYYEILLNYDWPGNIRELKNAVQYSIAILDEPILSEKHLIGFFTQIQQNNNKKQEKQTDDNSIKQLSELEKNVIQEALLVTKGNKSNAAKLLGISRATIHRKLKN